MTLCIFNEGFKRLKFSNRYGDVIHDVPEIAGVDGETNKTITDDKNNDKDNNI